MKRLFFFLISFCALLSGFAQKEISLDSIPKKETGDKIIFLSPNQPLFSENQPITGSFFSDTHFLFNQPLLPDYTKNLDFKKYFKVSSIANSYTLTGTLFNPFISTGKIFSQSTYQLNDHFMVGGNSFGASTIFDKPVLNPDIQQMNIKGASMFMQYKVSDKFKIETRVSISNGRSPMIP